MSQVRQDDAAAKLHRLEFYGDRPVAAAASAAYGAAWSWGVYGKYNDPDDFHERQQKYDDAELEMLLLMHRSLSIPDADPLLPPPSYSYRELTPEETESDETGPDPAETR